MPPPPVDLARWRGPRDDVVLADVRWYLDGRSGRAAYEAGHLPGAVFVDVDTALATHGRATDGRHPLPAPEAFAAAMAGLGIGDDDVVVGYDDDGGVIAARLVWMLRATGPPAALLDGGLRPDHDELVTEPVRRPPARFTSRPWPPEGLAELAGAGHRAHP